MNANTYEHPTRRERVLRLARSRGDRTAVAILEAPRRRVVDQEWTEAENREGWGK